MSTKVDLTSSERTFYGTQFRGSLMLSLSWPGCLGAINGRKAPPKRSLDGAPSNWLGRSAPTYSETFLGCVI